MDSDTLQQQDAATALIIVVAQNAEELACLTADYLDALVPDARARRKKWSPELLLELGGALKLRSWEWAGIKDQVDSSLPQSHEVLASLEQSLLADDEWSGDTSLAERVQICWWERTAHPRSRCLKEDFALSLTDDRKLMTFLAKMAWKVRHLSTANVERI